MTTFEDPANEIQQGWPERLIESGWLGLIIFCACCGVPALLGLGIWAYKDLWSLAICVSILVGCVVVLGGAFGLMAFFEDDEKHARNDWRKHRKANNAG